jgi:endo-1,3(4)-beta-glucanase
VCSSDLDGACVLSCAAGTLACDGACVDPLADRQYCGASGTCTGDLVGQACAAGEICDQGHCTASCGNGLIVCGDGCVDPLTSRDFCGASDPCTGAAAGTACQAGEICAGGLCTASCFAGQLACGGTCIDPHSDPAWCGAHGDCSGASAGVACAADQACVDGACVQLCPAVALDLTTPLATGATPFASVTQPAAYQPTASWGTLPAPRPTTTAWQNLILGSGQSRIDLAPYQARALPEGLNVARVDPTASATSVQVADVRQLTLGAGQAFTSHAVIAYDLLSVTLRYKATAGTMTLPLVQGMPYVTADYAGLTPVLLPGQYSFASVNGSSTPGSVTGVRFLVGLSDGSSWLVYASSPISITWNATRFGAGSSFTGTVRVASLPTPAMASVLDAHAGAIPRGGEPQVSIACDVATLRFAYATSGQGPLLMMALPHHLARLVAPQLAGLTYSTLTGVQQAVVGSSWTMRLPLTTKDWSAPRAPTAAHLTDVISALAVDSAFVPDTTTVDGDPYFGGKQLAKLARLVLIADQLGDTDTASTLRARLAPLEAAWLDGKNGNPLRYDTTWGGVVTANGLANPDADFGQGHYNDHHFHYGYHLYAAAAVARFDPGFAAAHHAGLYALIRDIANPAVADTYFPRFRHMDFYRSHSWANGLNEWPDGNNQESTSEALNAWYGMYLVGLAVGDARVAELGRVLAALELDGAQTYWQVDPAASVYPQVFAQGACVGRLFEAQATFSTWFGGNPEYVYGIQMLPYTPLTEDLLSHEWITAAWPTIHAATGSASVGWQGLLSMAHAVIAREAAFAELSALSSWDDGNSRTNALWWAATRP